MERDARIEQRDIDPGKVYLYIKAKWALSLQKLKKQSKILGWLRLVIFILAVTVPFVYFELFSPFFFTALFIPVILFVWVVKYAGKVNENIRYASYMVEINSIETDALMNNVETLPQGDEFIDPQHDFAHDLDIFGKGSLFQFINRTATRGGYDKLAGKLMNPLLNKKQISNKQELISELSSNLKFRHSFYAIGRMVDEEKQQKEALENISNIDFSFFRTKEYVLTIVFPVIVAITGGFVTGGVIPVKILVYLFFAGLLISGIYFKRVTKIHKQLSRLGGVLSGYSRLINLVESEEFGASGLTELQERLKSRGDKASGIIHQLGKYVNMLDQRLNMFVGPVLNGFFLWDLIIVRSIKRWFEENNVHIEEWFNILHELDALNSLAGFSYNHPGFIFPEFSDSDAVKAEDLGHPLIPGKERINNMFAVAEETRIVIVTGANMAGKSTFLRTVGVNMVLAATGTKVCASAFRYNPMRLITSMRAIDSLYKHESYFFSELKRLKYIVDEIKSGEQVFFILDEILKGTNSHDKTKGSIALTEQLLKLGSAGIIATHDLELGKLSEMYQGRIINSCFEVEFDNGKLIFDYILRKGITHSHNATYLMKNMGLI